jgi:hypothetical protein
VVNDALKTQAKGGRVAGKVEKSMGDKPTYTFSVRVVDDPVFVTVNAAGDVIKD